MTSDDALCIATYFKGDAFLRECRRLGCTRPAADRRLARRRRVAARGDRRDPHHRAATRSATRHPPPRRRASRARTASIASPRSTTSTSRPPPCCASTCRCPGIGRDRRARGFRDKLAMRVRARAIGGFACPNSRRCSTTRSCTTCTGRVPPPWVLKPRSSAAAIGIKKVAGPRRAVARARSRRRRPVERRARTVRRRATCITSTRSCWNGARRLRGRVQVRPAADGGRAPGRHLHHAAAAATIPTRHGRCSTVNQRLQDGLGLQRGVSHTEFIRARRRRVRLPRDVRARRRRLHRRHHRSGDRHQPLARVGEGSKSPARTATTRCRRHRRTTPASSCRWRGRRSRTCPRYTDPEIVTTIRKPHHAGLIVGSPDPQRIERADRRLHAALLPRLLRAAPRPTAGRMRPVE